MIWFNAVACRIQLQKMGDPVSAKEVQFCEKVFKGFVTKEYIVIRATTANPIP
jgi:hypothetical protein